MALQIVIKNFNEKTNKKACIFMWLLSGKIFVYTFPGLNFSVRFKTKGQQSHWSNVWG